MGRADSPLTNRVAFLVGVRRSGTNWLRRIVDAHPDAAVIPSETCLLSHGIQPITERVQHGLAGSARTATMYADRDRFHDALRDLCDRLLLEHLETLDREVQVLGERTPDHVRYLHLVRDVYPDAAVVHILRDGRDVARSLVSQAWGPTDHRTAALEWVSGIEAARAVAPELDRYLEVGYEQLLADPATWVPTIYRFLGLDDRPEVIERALAEARVPYNVDPLVEGVSAQKWRGGLSGAELADVLDVAGPLLDALGYDTSDGGTSAAAGGPALTDRALSAAASLRRQLDTGVSAVRDRVGQRGARPRGFQRHILGTMNSTMRVLDAFLDDVSARRFDALGGSFSDDARIRVVGAGEAWDERGPDAVRRLGTVLAQDEALAGRQLRGDVHPGVPSFTVVSTWETDDGPVDRVLVVASYGDRIDELTWYRLPRLAHPRADGAR